MEIVEIKHEKGCAVACLAMILGVTYDENSGSVQSGFQ